MCWRHARALKLTDIAASDSIGGQWTVTVISNSKPVLRYSGTRVKKGVLKTVFLVLQLLVFWPLSLLVLALRRWLDAGTVFRLCARCAMGYLFVCVLFLF